MWQAGGRGPADGSSRAGATWVWDGGGRASIQEAPWCVRGGPGAPPGACPSAGLHQALPRVSASHCFPCRPLRGAERFAPREQMRHRGTPGATLCGACTPSSAGVAACSSLCAPISHEDSSDSAVGPGHVASFAFIASLDATSTPGLSSERRAGAQAREFGEGTPCAQRRVVSGRGGSGPASPGNPSLRSGGLSRPGRRDLLTRLACWPKAAPGARPGRCWEHFIPFPFTLRWTPGRHGPCRLLNASP